MNKKMKKKMKSKNKTAQPAYAAIVWRIDGFLAAILEKDRKVSSKRIVAIVGNRRRSARKFLRDYQKKHNIKIVAVGICGGKKRRNERFGSDLWLKDDIVPHFFPSKQLKSDDAMAKSMARDVSKKYKDGWIAEPEIGRRREVNPSFLTTLEEYRTVCSSREFSKLLKLVSTFNKKGLKMVFFSSTPNGGGVALMRHAIIRLMRLLGADVSWHVMLPDERVFEVTKRKFHNILQAIAPDGIALTESDKKIYNSWIRKNAKLFHEVFVHADVVVIDDPQPSGMIPYIRKANPRVKIIYRSHIQVRSDLLGKKGSPQKKTWDFLKDNILSAEMFISHPIKEFVPKDIPKKKVVFAPATTDPLDGLNKRLTSEQMRHYEDMFNDYLIENSQKPLDFDRPYVIQVARFDPSKGIPDVMEAYRRMRKKFSDLEVPKKHIPQLVITGNGAVDDPESDTILQNVLFLLEMELYRPIADDIKIVRIPHIDQVLDTLMRRSDVALQLSHREGFEIKVTEALHKGVPVVVYRSGGIPLQVRNGKDGLVVPTGDAKKVSENLYKLFSDTKLRDNVGKYAQDNVNREYFTVANVTSWLELALKVCE